MNELCLCEVAEIHFVVSNMDFYTGRSLMSLHVFKILFVRAFMCVCSCLIVCVKVFSCLCVCVWVHLSVFLCVCVCVRVFSGVWHVWQVRGVASGIQTTTPAATWTAAWLAPTSSSTVRSVLSRVNTSCHLWKEVSDKWKKCSRSF